jgi:hypothetical protein
LGVLVWGVRTPPPRKLVDIRGVWTPPRRKLLDIRGVRIKPPNRPK